MLKLLPLFYGLILFLTIRLAVDVPTDADYLAHSPGFIATELTGVVLGSYLYFYLANKWIMFCLRHRINPVAEYLAIVLAPLSLSLIVMAISHETSLYAEVRDLIIPVIITVLMSLWLYLSLKAGVMQRLYAEARLRRQEAETLRADTEMRMLRAQFHPHFLFNMLNTIYFTVDESNIRARTTIEHLANLLRSQIYDDTGPVTVQRELSALDSYIELCRIRFSESTIVSTDIDRRYGSCMIHPHLLLPLVENAFKHSSGSPRRISIILKRTADTLDLNIENSIGPDFSSSNGTGIGLDNLRRRLETLYPEFRHKLNLSVSSTTFTAQLHLVL